jgi:hypothetical protein
MRGRIICPSHLRREPVQGAASGFTNLGRSRDRETEEGRRTWLISGTKKIYTWGHPIEAARVAQ